MAEHLILSPCCASKMKQFYTVSSDFAAAKCKQCKAIYLVSLTLDQVTRELSVLLDRQGKSDG